MSAHLQNSGYASAGFGSAGRVPLDKQSGLSVVDDMVDDGQGGAGQPRKSSTASSIFSKLPKNGQQQDVHARQQSMMADSFLGNIPIPAELDPRPQPKSADYSAFNPPS